MKVLLDTSVLVAAIVEAHPRHERGLAWLKRVVTGQDQGVVAAHSLAELYAVLTTLPVYPPISAWEAKELIQRNVIEHLELVSLNGREYQEVIEHLTALGIVGGAVYDALILRSGVKAGVDLVVTFNEKDFQRIYPELAGKVVSP